MLLRGFDAIPQKAANMRIRTIRRKLYPRLSYDNAAAHK